MPAKQKKDNRNEQKWLQLESRAHKSCRKQTSSVDNKEIVLAVIAKQNL